MIERRTFLMVGLAVSMTILVGQASAVSFELRQSFLAPELANIEIFGGFTRVGATSGHVVLGISGVSYLDPETQDYAGPFGGGAYVFDAGTGDFERLIAPPIALDPYIDGPQFGISMGSVGDNVLIGSRSGYPDDLRPAVGAWLVSPATGEVVREFQSPSGNTVQQFGSVVAVAGASFAIGTDLAEFNDVSHQQAYVFDDAGRHDIGNPKPDEFRYLGPYIALSDELFAMAGLPSPNEMRPGEIYLYDRDAYALKTTIGDPSPTRGDGFGSLLEIIGDKVVAVGDFPNRDRGGTLYWFDATSGKLEHEVTIPELAGATFYNREMVRYGDDLLVSGHGVAFLLDGATGELLATINHPDPTVIAFDVEVVGDRLLLGGRRAGYLFVPVPEPTGAVLALVLVVPILYRFVRRGLGSAVEST